MLTPSWNLLDRSPISPPHSSPQQFCSCHCQCCMTLWSVNRYKLWDRLLPDSELLEIRERVPFILGCPEPTQGEWLRNIYWMTERRSFTPDYLSLITSCLFFPAYLHLHNCMTRSISSLPLPSCVRPFVTPWTAAYQDSLAFTISQNLCKLMIIKSVMPSNHLILCRPLLLPSNFPSIRVFSNESALPIRWPKY